MKKTSQIFLIFLLTYASLLHAEEMLPKPFEASFKIFKKGIEVAEMHRSLSRKNNGEYRYRSEINSTGFAALFYKLHILEQSHWQLRNQRLEPLIYSYKRIKKKKDSHQEIIFDWKNNQAKSSRNREKSTLILKPGMTDKLLYQINIMRDLKIGTQPKSYTVVDGAKIKTYYFKYLGEELIRTPIGKFNTVKFLRQKPGDKEKIILWCANNLHFLPIKVENEDDDGSITTAIINQLTGLTQPQGIYSSTEPSE